MINSLITKINSIDISYVANEDYRNGFNQGRAAAILAIREHEAAALVGRFKSLVKKLESIQVPALSGGRMGYFLPYKQTVEIIHEHETQPPDKSNALKQVRTVLGKYYPVEATRLYDIFTGYVLKVYEQAMGTFSVHPATSKMAEGATRKAVGQESPATDTLRELLPCPFCPAGGMPEKTPTHCSPDRGTVRCLICKAEAHVTVWNNRTTAPTKPTKESKYKPTPDNPCGHTLRIHDVCERCSTIGSVEHFINQQKREISDQSCLDHVGGRLAQIIAEASSALRAVSDLKTKSKPKPEVIKARIIGITNTNGETENVMFSVKGGKKVADQDGVRNNRSRGKIQWLTSR